jgi:hypothetical protein
VLGSGVRMASLNLQFGTATTRRECSTAAGKGLVGVGVWRRDAFCVFCVFCALCVFCVGVFCAFCVFCVFSVCSMFCVCFVCLVNYLFFVGVWICWRRGGYEVFTWDPPSSDDDSSGDPSDGSSSAGSD